MTLDYTLFTNDSHLVHFSFIMGMKEIINWKPTKLFDDYISSAINGPMVLETYIHHCACISLLTKGFQHSFIEVRQTHNVSIESVTLLKMNNYIFETNGWKFSYIGEIISTTLKHYNVVS